jgi:VCBS repeat-containing protein/autotransporter-associated beta strand protein
MPSPLGHDNSEPSGSTAPSGTAATFSTDSAFSAVITESDAAQTVTGKIIVIDPDAGQACLDLARTLGYSTASDYYKTGEATNTGSYYGSKTIFTLLSNNQLAVISDGDPYPAKAGAINFTNDLISRRFPGLSSIIEQDFEYKFTYRGGDLNSDASYSNFFSTSGMGVQGIFLNGVALYNPSSGNGTVTGTTISGSNIHNLNAVFFERQYGIDESGGHPSPEGNVVNQKTGQYHYHDPMFLTSGSWNNETFASSNTYFSSDYYTDASNIDYIRHANGHSKIVGFCFDGYPIYGPYGYDGSFNSNSPSVLMTTSYQTKTTEFSGRPYTYDASLSGYTLSAGAFLDDYEYVPGMGSLDDCNGRFCVTPEYPNGTYAYFVLINEADEPVFPYILGKYSRQQRTVMNGGYPVDNHETGGSVTPTTGTAGVFSVSTLGVSKYVSAPINETIVDVSYGSFTIDSSGNWSYTMDGPHDEFETDVSYNDSMRVYSYDGSANRLVTVTMMGTAEAPVGPTPSVLTGDNNADTQGLTYSLDSPAEGQATVSGYTGTDNANIVIPAQVSKEGTTYNVVNIDLWGALIDKTYASITVSNGHPYYVTDANGLLYKKVDNELSVIWAPSSTTSIVIPDSINNTNVTGVEASAFDGSPLVTSVTFGMNIKFIRSAAFLNLTNLANITIPDSVTLIESGVFQGTGLTSVTFGQNPSPLTIGSYAFSSTPLTSFIIPNSVTSIGEQVFNNCSLLTAVTVPNSITTSDFLQNALAITDIILSTDNPNFVFSNGILYKKLADGLQVAWVNCVSNITIPSLVNNVSVLSLGTSSITNSRTLLTSVTIPDSVTSIGSYAFSSCKLLTAVTIPDSVTSIGQGAFEQCSELTAVTIPDAVTSIGESAFNTCSKLTAVTIGESVTTIGISAFVFCTALTAVIIPDSVTYIGDMAFYNGIYGDAGQMTALTIGAGVTHIGSRAFELSSLTAVTIPASVTYIGEGAFFIASLKDVYFLGNNETASYGDPAASHDFFGYGQFVKDRNAVPLVSSIAPDAVAYYVNGKSGWNVYSSSNPPAGFSNIQTFVPEGSGPTASALDTNNADTQGLTYTLDSPAEGQATVADYSGPDNASIVIPAQVSKDGTSYTVTSIGYGAFQASSTLNAVIIGASVTSIDVAAFRYCSELTAVTIGSNVQSIGSSAFKGCSKLTAVIIPDAVTSIGVEAFFKCFALTAVTIGANVTTIGNDAFRECSELTAVIIPDSVTSIGENAFRECSELTAVTIPDAVTSIGSYAFMWCSKLTAVTIPNAVTSISQGAFAVCSALTTVIIPDAVTTIGSSAFEQCSALTTVTIGANVTSIGDNAFNGCFALTAVIIPNAVTSIGSGAFYECIALTAVTIPASVTYIGLSAFSIATLTNVYFLGNNETALYEGQNYDFFGYGQFVKDRNAVPLVSAIAPDAVAYYVNGKSGWNVYSSSNPPAGFSNIQTFVPEGSGSASDHSSGSLTLADGAQIGNVSGGNVTVSSGTAAILSTTGTFVMNLHAGNANVTTLNGSESANATISANRILSTSAGLFTGMLYGAGTLEKTGSGTLTLSGSSSMGFSGKVAIKDGTVEAQTTTSLSGAAVELGSQGSNTSPVLKFNISGSTTSVIGNPIRALSSGSNIVQNAGTNKLSFAGGLEKNGTPLIFVGNIDVNSDITGSSANSDVILGDGSTSTADVTLVSGNTYDYNGPTTVNTGSTLTLQDGNVNLTNSDVTIDAGATLVLEYTTSTITANSVKSLVLDGTLAINLNATLTAGTYTLLNYTGNFGIVSATISYSGASNASSFNVTGNLTMSAYTITVSAKPPTTYTVGGTISGLATGKSAVLRISSAATGGVSTNLTVSSNGPFTSNFTGFETDNYFVSITTQPDGQTGVITNSSGTISTSNITNVSIAFANNSTPTIPSSNVCFPAKTPVMTNQGPVNIEDIDPAVHTIRNKKIVAITKTVAHDKNLVRIAKHALGHLYPEKTTLISQNHKVLCQGQMIKAKHLVDDCNVTLVPYNGQVLYNVLLAEHEKMQVNNLIVETLHPEHKVAKLYRFLKNVDAAHHGKLIAAFNKKDLEHRSHL